MARSGRFDLREKTILITGAGSGIGAACASRVPTIVTVYLDRPAVLTNIKDKAAAILANFGVGDTALFQVLTGKSRPEAKLPFELPSSMAEVALQRPDLAHDTAHPLYPIGFGLTYP